MAAFRPSLRRLSTGKKLPSKLVRQAIRERLAASGRKLEDFQSKKIPVIPQCPSPTCDCAEMPPDLDIDTSRDLNGTMAAYSEQILITTGQADWKSKIEDEKDTAPWGSVVAQIKELLGPKGHFHDPYRNIVVSTSSFGAPGGHDSDQPQALLFPTFSFVTGLEPSESGVRHFLETFVLSKGTQEKDTKIRQEQGRQGSETSSATGWSGSVHPISTPTILVCSHNSRDSRCGILGPLLHAEFVQYINKRHTLRNQVVSDMVSHNSVENGEEIRSFASHPLFQPEAIDVDHNNHHPVNVGMISHVGGHKWAGNVIVYIPPGYSLRPVERQSRGSNPKDRVATGEAEPIVPENHALTAEEGNAHLSPLAGKGIWYGRVQPKHVEGIVEQTIGHGKIIQELFRGGVNQNGSTLRI